MRTLRALFVSLLPLVTAASLPGGRAAAADWVSTGLPNGYRYALALGPAGEVYACAGGQVYRSIDDGATWTARGPFAANALPRALACSPSGALFGGDIASGVYRSDDGGASWSPGLASEGCDALAVHPQGVVLAGLTYTGNGKVHRSENLGEDWLAVALPGASGSSSTACFAFGAAGDAYAGSIDGVYRSDDLGLSWQQRNTGLSGRHVRVLAMAPNQHLFALTLFSSSIDGLYRSTDGAASWQRLGLSPYFASLIASPRGELYGVSDDEVHESGDDGVHWTSISDGIAANEQLVSIVLTRSGHLIAGGYHVWRRTPVVAGVADDAPRAGRDELLPSSPNPCAGVARVEFALGASARVDLALFDVAGRRVATLAEGVLAPGPHAVTLDASTLPSGVYLCRLLSNGVAHSRRLLVTR